MRVELNYEARPTGGIIRWPTVLKSCSLPRPRPSSSRWGATENSPQSQDAWEDNKVIREGEELVMRVDRARWFITMHPPAFRFS